MSKSYDNDFNAPPQLPEDQLFGRVAMPYAKMGKPVFPCKPDTKAPMIEGGFKRATTERTIIAEWARQYQKAMVGMPTGKVSGVSVLDFDPMCGATPEQMLPGMPETRTHGTPNGGVHKLFKYTPDLRTIGTGVIELPEGVCTCEPDAPKKCAIDLRNDGGYIIMPQSVREDGVAYTVISNAAPAEVPEWIISKVRSQKTTNARAISAPGATIPEGGRNHALASLAGTMRSKGMSAAVIEAALQVENTEKCDPPLSEIEVSAIAASIGSYPAGTQSMKEFAADSYDVSGVVEAWPDVQDLPSATPPVPLLPVDLLPEVFREYIVETAKRAPYPIELMTVGIFSSLGSVIGRRCGIKPERFNNFTIIPNLWGAAIGTSASKKTGAVKSGTEFIEQLDQEAAREFEQGNAGREVDEMMFKNEESNLASLLKAAQNKPDPDPKEIDHIKAEVTALKKKNEDETETAKRFVIKDATVEAIGEILNKNPNGLMSVQDELAGMLAKLDKNPNSGDREFWLDSWSSKTNYPVDRIGRGHLRIKALTLTLFGGIQPGKLEQYVTAAIAGGSGADGLLPRIQLMVWPDRDALPTWKPETSPMDESLRRRAYDVFKRCSEIQLPGVDPDDLTQIPVVNFTAEAQEEHTKWRIELELRIKEEMLHTPAFESHMTKFLSAVPALALIYYLADLPVGEQIVAVPIGALELAIDMSRYLEEHARKVYAPELNPGLNNAYALSRKILSGAVVDGASPPNIYNHHWKDLTDAKSVYAAIEVLERLGWLRTVRQDRTGGRPSDSIAINPKLLKGKN